jgi:hypothetical protein
MTLHSLLIGPAEITNSWHSEHTKKDGYHRRSRGDTRRGKRGSAHSLSFSFAPNLRPANAEIALRPQFSWCRVRQIRLWALFVFHGLIEQQASSDVLGVCTQVCWSFAQRVFSANYLNYDMRVCVCRQFPSAESYSWRGAREGSRFGAACLPAHKVVINLI